ncbi:putative peptide chain release factor-like protein [Staphylotrichum tortipilum]|uniref:Peptide chain release factor-like protein n=1 Tax=Staphylotrichum tortipilum TaxID=2831512 RepID=A0AAN6RXE4_9PEZI|nr:putative peptide chain release factor-like protein [Staphylotrichum longicolle]
MIRPLPTLLRSLPRLFLFRGALLTTAALPLHNPPAPAAAFTTSPNPNAKPTQMPSRPKPPPESEIEEFFVKGSGPGGQKINKTASAVQLRHIPTGIVVKSQATRSRSQNRKIARDQLAARLDELANGAQSRTAVVGAAKLKKAASKAKKSRRKYRKLAEATTAACGGEEEGRAVDDEGVEDEWIEEEEEEVEVEAVEAVGSKEQEPQGQQNQRGDEGKAVQEQQTETHDTNGRKP